MGERLIPILVSHEHPGSELDGDVLEFIQAMAAYQKRYRRRYPMWSEILYVLRTLGYAKRVPGAVFEANQVGSADDADSSTDETDQKKMSV